MIMIPTATTYKVVLVLATSFVVIGCDHDLFVKAYPSPFLLSELSADTASVKKTVTKTIVPGDWENCFSFGLAGQTAYIRTTKQGHKAIQVAWADLVCIQDPLDYDGSKVAACKANIRQLLKQKRKKLYPTRSGANAK